MNMMKLEYSTMNTNLQSQNPNSLSPNYDHIPFNENQIVDPLYFQIANYLMSDEDCGSKVNTSFQIKDDVVDCSSGSSSSVPFVNQIKRKGVTDKYKAQDDCRFAFRTKTQLEVMDDGYKWRKYGKKMVKNNPNPRNYYKCSSGGCKVKKRVERDSLDQNYVITTYQGTHNHASPNCILYCSPSSPLSFI